MTKTILGDEIFQLFILYIFCHSLNYYIYITAHILIIPNILISNFNNKTMTDTMLETINRFFHIIANNE